MLYTVETAGNQTSTFNAFGKEFIPHRIVGTALTFRFKCCYPKMEE